MKRFLLGFLSNILLQYETDVVQEPFRCCFQHCPDYMWRTLNILDRKTNVVTSWQSQIQNWNPQIKETEYPTTKRCQTLPLTDEKHWGLVIRQSCCFQNMFILIPTDASFFSCHPVLCFLSLQSLIMNQMRDVVLTFLFLLYISDILVYVVYRSKKWF